MLERECWRSLWILSVLFKLVWKEQALAIINSVNIEMISYLPLLQGLNLYVLYSKIRFLMLKLKILEPKILIEDPDHILVIPWSILTPFSPLSPGNAQFIFQIVKIAHKTANHLFIVSILLFHYLMSFWGIWQYHIWSSLKPYQTLGILHDIEEVV